MVYRYVTAIEQTYYHPNSLSHSTATCLIFIKTGDAQRSVLLFHAFSPLPDSYTDGCNPHVNILHRIFSILISYNWKIIAHITKTFSTLLDFFQDEKYKIYMSSVASSSAPKYFSSLRLYTFYISWITPLRYGLPLTVYQKLSLVLFGVTCFFFL